MKTLSLHETADIDRPYERCIRHGAASLSDAQLLAVIIRTGTQGKTAIQLSEDILQLSKKEPGLLGICHLSIEELTALNGIGTIKAIQIKCIGELSRRISTYRAKNMLSFTRPDTIADYYMEQLRHEEQENLICMMLDTKSHLIGEKCVTQGTVNASLISTRELFLEALRFHAVNILLVHNHPSGDATPSSEDQRVTEKVKRAGMLLDIQLLDHIIIGDKSYISFRESNLL